MFRLTALFHKQGFPWKTIFLLALILMGCNSTKYVQDGDYLLNSVEIHNSTKDVSKEELKSYLRQKENVKILGFWRFHLGLYNLSGQKNTGLNRWLKKVGVITSYSIHYTKLYDFYNQRSEEGKLVPIVPTPVIGMVGLVEDKKNHCTLSFRHKGDMIFLIGRSRDDVNSSEYASTVLRNNFV